MKCVMTSLVAAAALAMAPAALAQQPAPPPDQPVPQEDPQQQVPADVSEDDLETFADIYVDLEETVTKFESEMSSVETEQEAQDVQVRMQQESFEKIAERGWTPEKFNMVVQAVNSDPTLLERALQLIDERS